jgi:hypothetical protein
MSRYRSAAEKESATSALSKYGRMADDCLQKAISAASAPIADEWLRMAGTWLAMEQFHNRIALRKLPTRHS